MPGPDRNAVDVLPSRFTSANRLGDGGQGGSFVAVDAETGGRRVVLKRVDGAVHRALAGAFSVLRRVASPHLPAVHELLEEEDGAWLVTAWIEGQPLAPGPAPLGEVLAEALGVAHALAAIHRVGTHHGDVSPTNILRTPTRGVVLTDLGQVGALGCGTPGFLAPEVLAGGGGPLADRFALGCLICVRLFGQVPWRTPQALVSVRDAAAVRGRLVAIEQATDVLVPPAVLGLLERLLAPDPTQRVQDADLLVRHLQRLHQATLAGADLESVVHWWLPARWPFTGPSLGPTIERLVGPAPAKLVLVVGASGSGRRRLVEELVMAVQERGGASARLVDAGALGRVLGGEDAGWLEAWLAADASPALLGVIGELSWSGTAAASDERGLQARASLLRLGASVGVQTLVTAVSPALADAVFAESAPGVIRFEVPGWSERDIEVVLAPVLEGGDRRAWASALYTATAGSPSRTVRAIEAAGRLGASEPDLLRIAEAAGESTRLEPTLARRVLERHWGEGDRDLPAYLLSEGEPLAWAVAAAQRTFGDQVQGLARDLLARRERGVDGSPVRLALALDADASALLLAHLTRARVEERDLDARLVRWIERESTTMLDDSDAGYVTAELLRTGNAARACAFAERWPGVPRVELERARALQQLGRAEAALKRLDELRIDSAAEPGLARRRLGLRLRVLVDLGRAREAVEQAGRELSRDTGEQGPEPATAWLWAGMAATAVGDDELAHAWLGHAEKCLGEGDEGGRASLRARVHQLQANLAESQGDLVRAADHYRRAGDGFRRAREPVGSLFASSSLAALAFPSGEIAEGIERGRAALRGLIARGQVAALPVALFNLCQCLCRVGANDEATRWRALVGVLVEPAGPDARLAQARLLRIDADLAAHGRAGSRADREGRYVASARELERADAPREAADAWLRAAVHARIDGRCGDALRNLQCARVDEASSRDAGLELELALEQLAIAAAVGDQVQLGKAVAALAVHPGPVQLLERGRLELAFVHDRSVLAALQAVHGVGDPTNRVVAHRMLSTLEVLMNKVTNLDRAAARSALLSDGNDASPLRDLVRELEADVARLDGAGAVGPAAEPRPGRRVEAGPGDEGRRLAGIIRIYRRLAREDELERLLEQVVDAMMELTDAERGVVVVRRHGDERLEVAREIAGAGDAVTFSSSVIQRVLETAEPVISVDAAEDERFDGSRSISHLNLRSVLAVPLLFRGEVLGAAYVDHRLRRGAFDEHDLAHVEDFADLAALAVANARALDGVRRQASALKEQGTQLERLLERREAEVEGLRAEVRQAAPERRSYRGMVGASDHMQKVFRLVDRLAESDVPVVIYGESGTGKELVARAIHDAGPRRDRPFVAENCGAIPETLLESVLFGHAKGAFTGAQKPKAGLFEAASGGTIFLDEVGEMSPGMQTKLLRVLQEGEVRRVGENAPRTVDVRVIAASNRDLEAMVEAGQFRADLFYRIHVVKMELPALRARTADIPALIEHFLERHRHGKSGLEVTASAMRLLVRYAWPGNVREVENEVQRWLALVEERVRPEDLSPAILGAGNEDAVDPDDLRLRPRVDRLERDLIAKAIERTRGNQTQAAALLGLSRFGLQKKLRRIVEDDKGAPT